MNNVMYALKLLIDANLSEPSRTPFSKELSKAINNAKEVFAEYNTEEVQWCKTCNVEIDKEHYQDHVDAECKIGSFYEYRAYKEGRNVIKMLNGITNGNPVTVVADGMMEEMNRTHRHLQSEILLVLSQFITKYGELDQEKYADGRNAHMMATARRMGDAI